MPSTLAKMASLFLATALLTVGANAVPAHGSASLDRSFGQNGFAFAERLPGRKPIGPAIKVRADARSRVTVLGNDSGDELVLGRFQPNGRLDPSFGKKGLLYTSALRRDQPIGYGADFYTGGHGSIVTTGPVDPAGKWDTDTFMCFTSAKFKAAGFLDLTFGKKGRRMVCSNRRSPSWGLDSKAITPGRNGGFFVAGEINYTDSRSGPFIAKLKAKSGLDRSFRGSYQTRYVFPGVVRISPGVFGRSSFSSLSVLRDGRILAAGTMDRQFGAARFLPGGALDKSFGANGVAKFDPDGDPTCECSFMRAMKRDRQGRIVMAGYTIQKDGHLDGNARLALIRLTKNGRLDRSFGVDGVARPHLSEFRQENDSSLQRFLTTGVALQADGKIVVTGDYNFRFGVVRLDPGGGLDRTFFDDGEFARWLRGGYGAAWDVTIDRRKRLIVSGGTQEGEFVVARINPR